MDNATNIVDMVAQGTEIPMVEVSAPRLARMESESRLLSVLLEQGVIEWEGYADALKVYREEGKETV